MDSELRAQVGIVADDRLERSVPKSTEERKVQKIQEKEEKVE